jgi:hypothetical protein
LKLSFFPPVSCRLSAGRADRTIWQPVEAAPVFGKGFPNLAAKSPVDQTAKREKSFSRELTHALLLVTREVQGVRKWQ